LGAFSPEDSCYLDAAFFRPDPWLPVLLFSSQPVVRKRRQFQLHYPDYSPCDPKLSQLRSMNAASARSERAN
jgi:hypothetical protein